MQAPMDRTFHKVNAPDILPVAMARPYFEIDDLKGERLIFLSSTRAASPVD